MFAGSFKHKEQQHLKEEVYLSLTGCFQWFCFQLS